MNQITCLLLVVVVANAAPAMAQSGSPLRSAAPVVEHGTLRMPDGSVLTHTVIEADAGHPRPVLLVRTPYQRKALIEPAKRFTSQGFCVVLQDCRGTGDSHGTFVPFLREAEDGARTFDWVLEQEWCDGRVATWGMSYLGITQWQLAPHAGKRLGAMVLNFTGSDCFRDLIHFGGSQSLGIALSWSLMTAGQPGVPRFQHLPLDQADDESGKDVPVWNDWVHHSSLDDYWKVVDFKDRYPQVESPALLAAGWYDLFQPGQIDDFMRLAKREGPVEQSFARLIVGPWDHMGTGSGQGRPDLGPNAYLSLDEEEDRFLARFVLGADNGYHEKAGVRAFFLGSNDWRELDGWPPSAAQPVEFYMHGFGSAHAVPSDGVLTQRAPSEEEPADPLNYDPADPTPSYAANLWTPLSSLRDLKEIGARPDVLVYTSLPMREDFVIAGPLSARLFVSSDVPDSDFTVMLVDVAPDGTTSWRGEGIQRARLRESVYELSAPLSVQPVALDVQMGHIACTIAKGHRVRVHVACANFPRFARHLNNDDPTGRLGEPAVAHHRLHKGPGLASHLKLFRIAVN